jgi:hypothetical protein
MKLTTIKLNAKEYAVLKSLRDNHESVHGDWGSVYLDNAGGGFSSRAYAGYLSALTEKGLYKSQEDGAFGDVDLNTLIEVEGVYTEKLTSGNYRITKFGAGSIEVCKESKKKWVNVDTGESRTTLKAFEEIAEALEAPKPVKKEKKAAAPKNVKATFYKGHRNERTAKLHHAFDTMDRKDALDFARKELGYTISGATSWFSDWDKASNKEAA